MKGTALPTVPIVLSVTWVISLADAATSPRFISLNDEGTIRGELVFHIPVSVFLQSITLRKSWHVPSDSPSNEMSIITSYRQTDTVPLQEAVNNKWSLTSSLLSRFYAYFNFLGVYDHTCRLRHLCQIVQSSKELAPLSDLISALAKIGEDSLLQETSADATLSHLLHFLIAVRKGQTGQDCRQRNPCEVDISHLLNMQTLIAWQRFADLVSVSLSDE